MCMINFHKRKYRYTVAVPSAGVSEVTVKVYRSKMLRKMKAGSLPELSLIADKLNLLSKPASS